MKFSVLNQVAPEQKKVVYVKEDLAFQTVPKSHGVSFYIAINQVTLGINHSNSIDSIEGFCPLSWKTLSLRVPAALRGVLQCGEQNEPGFVYGINKTDWPVVADSKTGWVCIGNPEMNEHAVEIMQNVIVVLSNGEIISIWIKPILQ